MAREYRSESDFFRHADELAERFRTRYGLRPEDDWTDAQIDQALADAGMPLMADLPPEPRGMMRELAEKLSGFTPKQAEQWRRTNAMHLLGHVMLHDGQRCPGCGDW